MKCRSLTKAAEQMHLSQPAISQALRDLEGQLGLTLFVRGGRLMRPTAEALALLSEVELLSARVGSLMARVTELRDRQAGQLAVATIPVLATGPLPLVIAKFLQQGLRRELVSCPLQPVRRSISSSRSVRTLDSFSHPYLRVELS